MAAGGYKEFVAGETLDEDEINDYLMQGMLVFAGTAARGSAIGTPVEGQFSFLTDSDSVEFFDGSQWVEFSTSPGAAVVSGTTGSPTVGTVSSGGTTYNVYSFTGSGSIIFSEAGFAELLVLGGGGSGGVGWAGGGGGGGHLSISQAYLPAGTATVVVGAGGAAPSSAGIDNFGMPGQNGVTSRISDFYSPGGGGGCGYSLDFPDVGTRGIRGLNGGSGGGASGRTLGANPVGGSGFSPLGNDGGSASSSAGAGGGGAGAVGANGDASTGGNGGAGLANSITGTSVTRAGGGGGGRATSAGSGGTGGGGAGGNLTATSGEANTGGGGGGSGSSDQASAGSGGSGIVIVRVAV